MDDDNSRREFILDSNGRLAPFPADLLQQSPESSPTRRSLESHCPLRGRPAWPGRANTWETSS